MKSDTINSSNIPKPFKLGEYEKYIIHRLVKIEDTGRRGSGKDNCSGYNLWMRGWDHMTVAEYQQMVEETCEKNDGQFNKSKHLNHDIRNGWVELVPPTENDVTQEKIIGAIAEEVTEPNKYFEGATKQISVNIYERNLQARTKCIQYYGYSCSVCDFNFGKLFGQLGKGFIHVHHLKPLSEIGHEYKLDPIKDLRPVCPNCHSMLHRRNPALSIEELIKTIM